MVCRQTVFRMFSLRPYRESTDCFLVGPLKSIAIKPAANMKSDFLTTNGEIMEYTFTSNIENLLAKLATKEEVAPITPVASTSAASIPYDEI